MDSSRLLLLGGGALVVWWLVRNGGLGTLPTVGSPPIGKALSIAPTGNPQGSGSWPQEWVCVWNANPDLQAYYGFSANLHSDDGTTFERWMTVNDGAFYRARYPAGCIK